MSYSIEIAKKQLFRRIINKTGVVYFYKKEEFKTKCIALLRDCDVIVYCFVKGKFFMYRSFVFFLLIQTCLSAAQNYYTEPLAPWDTCSKNKTAIPQTSAFTAPGLIDCNPSWHIGFGASLLYWQARQEGLDIAEIQPGTDSVDYEIVEQTYKYRPGVQAFLILKPKTDDWDATIRYTWYRAKNQTNITTKNNQLLIPRFFDSSVYLENMHSSWRVHLNLLDTELARAGFFGQRLICRPFIGSRGYLLQQRFSIKGFQFPILNLTNPSELVVTVLKQQVRHRSRCWALGPRIGVDLDFLLGWGMHTFANASGSIVYFNYNANFHREIEPNGLVRKVEMKEAAFLRTNAEISTGFGWGGYLANNRLYLDISTFFDLKCFSGQNVLRHLSDDANTRVDANYGDLYFMGGSLRMCLHF